MKKKILSMVLALVLVCGMLPMTVLAAGPDISFTSTAPVGGVAANDTFDVTVSSAEITGAYSIAVKVSFDRNKLEVTNLAWNTTVKSTVGSNVTEANNNGYFSKSYVDNEEGKALEVPANTNFVTATFKVKTGATAGNTDITLTQFSPTNETSAPIPVTIGTPTLSIPITLPANTITVTSDPSRDYNGSAISNPDVSKTSTDGTVSYEWFNDNSGAVGASLGTTAPINAGKYWVKASVTGSTTHADATSEAKVFTISRADYSFTPSVTTNVTVGNSYPTTDATVQGNGAGTEKVDGTLTWYTDSGCTAAATGTFATAGSTTLYWKFTPDSGETNYKADAKTGSTTFSVSALPAQTLSFEKTSITKTYGDAVFTNAVTNDRSDGGTVSYESSNTAVATVNGSGEVTIKGAGKATVTANVTAVSGKYAAGSANYTLTVSPKAITVTVTPATRKFGEANPTFTATVTSGSLVDLDTVDGLGLGLSSPAAAASNVGNYDVVGDGTYNSNYLVTVLGTKKLTVTKADAPTIAAQNISHKYSMSGTKTCAFPAGLPSDRGTTSFALGTEVNTAGVLTGTTTVNATTGEVSYTLASKPSYTAGQSATITVIITMQNYNDVTVNFVISLTDKDVPVLTANALTATYTGSDVPVSAVSGKTAKFGSNSVDGTWSWNGTAPKNAASAAPYTLKFTPTDGTTYAETTTTVSVTINKATPTGAPKYTAITAADKTLADAALTVGTIIPASGTIAWDDTANTKVTANTSYKWTVYPDRHNQLQ
jgi:hypothetical protein